jgi:hypothetical protein
MRLLLLLHWLRMFNNHCGAWLVNVFIKLISRDIIVGAFHYRLIRCGKSMSNTSIFEKLVSPLDILNLVNLPPLFVCLSNIHVLQMLVKLVVIFRGLVLG